MYPIVPREQIIKKHAAPMINRSLLMVESTLAVKSQVYLTKYAFLSEILKRQRCCQSNQ